MPVRNLVEQSFGRLIVVQRDGSTAGRHATWLCICACGKYVVVIGNNLLSGRSTSCGCIRIEQLTVRSTTHGQSRTPTWNSWAAMHARCAAKPAKSSEDGGRYRYYAERGISVCERWESFEAFLADMGRRPAGKTIDRINPDGNYEPGNCRWATPAEQTANRRNNEG